MSTNPDRVTRYVITHVNREGMRTLTFAAQGRNTYASAGEAQGMLDAFVETSLPNLLQVHGEQARGTFAVRPCECWPGHFDPCGVWFDN